MTSGYRQSLTRQGSFLWYQEANVLDLPHLLVPHGESTAPLHGAEAAPPGHSAWPPSAHQACVTLLSPWCPPRNPELLLLFKDDPENKLLIKISVKSLNLFTWFIRITISIPIFLKQFSSHLTTNSHMIGRGWWFHHSLGGLQRQRGVKGVQGHLLRHCDTLLVLKMR